MRKEILGFLLLFSLFLVSSSTPNGEGTWPEVVGLTGEAAREIIQKDVPGYKIEIIPPSTAVADELNLQRVRIFVDAKGIVLRPPRLG